MKFIDGDSFKNSIEQKIHPYPRLPDPYAVKLLRGLGIHAVVKGRGYLAPCCFGVDPIKHFAPFRVFGTTYKLKCVDPKNRFLKESPKYIHMKYEPYFGKTKV